MSASTNPLLRARNPFERRLIGQVESSKPHNGVGIFEKRLPGGVSQMLPRRRTSALLIHPFFILRTGKLHAGTVNSIIPTLSGDPIGESGNALTLEGDKYVYISNAWSVSFGSNNFLSAASLTTTTIITSPDPLTNEIGSGTYTAYWLVAQIIGGIVQRAQQTRTNMQNLLCDLSNGEEDGKSIGSTWLPS